MVFSTAAQKRARTFAAASTLALAVAGLGFGTQHAHAATPEGTLTGDSHTDKAYDMNLGWLPTSLMTLTPDAGGTVAVYCIERDTPTYPDGTIRYEAHGWDTYERNANWSAVSGKVAWILTHSYPRLDTATVLKASGYQGTADTSRIVAATQAAIWHYTQGFEPGQKAGAPNQFGTSSYSADSGISDEAALSVYRYLVGNATDAAAPKLSVSLTPDNPARGADGLFAPVTLKTTNAATVNATLPEGATVSIDGKPATLPAQIAQGEHTIDVTVPADTATGSTTITATSTGEAAPVGTIWQSTSGNYQSLITASSQSTTAQASTTLSWTKAEAPAPAVETPQSVESPKTQTPAPVAEPTTDAPAPVAEPTTVETPAPVVDSPKTEEPKVEVPKVEVPVVSQPAPAPTATTPQVERPVEIVRDETPAPVSTAPVAQPTTETPAPVTTTPVPTVPTLEETPKAEETPKTERPTTEAPAPVATTPVPSTTAAPTVDNPAALQAPGAASPANPLYAPKPVVPQQVRTAPAAKAAAATPARTLPWTGSHDMALALIGITLVGAGIGALAYARRGRA
ncbi:TQXA domain-containing protein [Austwickia chelonae]|nr:thioester domain-containing protein [Austwickia chelonae]SEW39567.1 TQXA domain-containing protein [Austwickia chelonae]